MDERRKIEGADRSRPAAIGSSRSTPFARREHNQKNQCAGWQNCFETVNSNPEPDGTFPLASAQEAKRLRARMSWKRKTTGGVLALAGYMLSPLSWWNDAVVNFPLALAFAGIVTLFYKLSIPGGQDRTRARVVFEASWIVGYWLTNVLGFVLMHKGAQKMLRQEDKK